MKPICFLVYWDHKTDMLKVKITPGIKYQNRTITDSDIRAARKQFKALSCKADQ